MSKTKERILSMVDFMVSNGEIKPIELLRYTNMALNLTDPKDVQYEMENWYRAAGIERITKKRLVISPCPYSSEEIKKIYEMNNMLLCIPKGITRETLGKLFHFNSWALHDDLVTRVEEKEDLWFFTSKSLKPIWMKKSGIEITNTINENEYVHFSLERYIIFLARSLYLTGHLPDEEYWIWLTSGRYDRSGMLMAGIDRKGNFNVHGWMPQFSASFLGGRYGQKKI